MSLAGSTVFLLYILIYPLTKKYFSLKWRYRILKIAAAFYLLPVPIYKYRIIYVIHIFFPWLWTQNRHISEIIDMKYIINVGQDFVEFSSGVKHMLLIELFMMIIALVIIQRKIIQYWKWKRVCKLDSDKPAEWEQEIFTKVKKDIGIKKDVKLICSKHCKSPMVSGILSSILILPIWEDNMETEEYEYIFRHELIHIKHYDLLMKYIGLLVMAVHWYNPLVYVMFYEISVISEMYCDSIVISGKEEEERRKYSDLILTLATQNEYTRKEIFFSGMANSRNKNMYKRRILEIKKYKRHKTVLSVIITIIICISGTVTTLAYEPPNIASGFSEHDSDGGGDFNSTFVIESAEVEQIKLPSDYFFTDDSGIIYDISSFDINNRVACVHDFSIHGTYNEHKKDGKGGCVVKSYDAFLCSRCYDVKTGKLKGTATYNPCPH